MKFYKTFLIIFLSLALLVYLAYFRINQNKKFEDKKIFNFKDKNLSYFLIDNIKNNEKLLLLNSKDDWKLLLLSEEEGSNFNREIFLKKENKFFRPDKFYLNNLLKALKQMVPEEEFEPSGSNLREYGLDEPRLRVEFELDDKSRYLFAIGKDSIFGGNVYILVKDIENRKEHIYLSNNFILSSFNKSFDTLRSHALVSFLKKDINKVRIVRKPVPTILKKSLIGWTITEPIEDRVNEFEINKFISAITTTNVKKFLNSDDIKKDFQKYNFKKPLLEIEVFLKEQKDPSRLIFVSNENNILVFNSTDEFIATIDSELFVKLDVSFHHLRNNDIFSFNKWEISKIEITTDGFLTQITKDSKNKWHLSQGDIKEKVLVSTSNDKIISSSDVDAFLDFMRTRKVESFVYNGKTPDLKKYALHDPKYSIALFSKADGDDERPVGKVYIGKTSKGSIAKNDLYYLKKENSSYIYSVDEKIIKSIPKEFLERNDENNYKKGMYLLEKTGSIEKLDDPIVKDDRSYIAMIFTDKGVIEVKFFSRKAPYTVSNFLNLARNGFYDNHKFHRVTKGFLVQTGDPTGTGKGGPGYFFKDEISSLKHLRGTVSMAKTAEPHTNGSQFFICLAPQPHLDNNHTIFGQVTKGMEVVDALEEQDSMLTVKVYEVFD